MQPFAVAGHLDVVRDGEAARSGKDWRYYISLFRQILSVGSRVSVQDL